jgi:hypothetical protein
MSKSVLVAVAVVALVSGCVSLTVPTSSPAPTAAPTVVPTPVLTAAPTPTSAPTASPEPSAAPTDQPTAEPTGQPSDFDDRDLLFNDDLTDPTGECAAPRGNAVPPDCFGVGEVTSTDPNTQANLHIGSVAYVDGALNFAVDNENGWMWSRRVVDAAHSTMRIAAEFIPASEGRFGLFCLSNDNDLWGAVVGTDGSWALGDLGENDAGTVGFNRLVEDQNAGLNVPIGESVPLAVECAGLITGGLRLTLSLDDTGPVAIYETNEGPDNFNMAAAYAEATGTATSVDVDDILVFGSGFADNQITDAAGDLMTHIPDDWQDQCYQSLRPPLFFGTAEAVVTCFLGTPGDDGAEIAEYASFLDADAMTDAYEDRVATFGPDEQADTCEEGSAERSYHFGAEGSPEVGRLMCGDQFRGARYDWTDIRLNILGTLVDFDGEYGKLWDDWQDAGPDL